MTHPTDRLLLLFSSGEYTEKHLTDYNLGMSIEGKKQTTDRIYLLSDEEGTDLQALEAQPYDSEDLLQTLLEKYPDLMAGEQVNSESPRRWLLVKREMGVPDTEHSGNRWSLDHLFLDQDGVPTLVEVKRATDTRARREVVAQMLDYASNAVLHWPLERIQSDLEETCAANNRECDEAILTLMDASSESSEEQIDNFWQSVKTNMEAGRLRLVFLADEIHRDLLHIVEFLNRQMNPCEVIAVELKQYVGQGLRTLVPRVIGQSVDAQRRKSPKQTKEGRDWSREEFLEWVNRRRGENAVSRITRIVSLAEELDLEIDWGTNKKEPSLWIGVLCDEDQVCWAFDIWVSGGLAFRRNLLMKYSPVFQTSSAQAKLIEIWNTVDGFIYDPDKAWQKAAQIETLSEHSFNHLVSVLHWTLQAIKSGSISHKLVTL